MIIAEKPAPNIKGKLDMLKEEIEAAEKKASGTTAAPGNTLYERGKADGLKQAHDLFAE